MSVVIETTIGDITVDLFVEERPVACTNFLKLCKLKYYNYNLFHTVEHGFIAQTGDPGGTGSGGSSVWGILEGNHKRFFEAEYIPKIHHTSSGLVSLVGVSKHLVGSQFLITLGDDLTSLDEQHCVIGEVVEGHEVLRQLNEAIVDEEFRPYQDIRITHTVVLDDPFVDPKGLREPSRSPSPSAERLQNGRIAADEDIDDTAGKSMEEIQEMLAEREAKARATILEIVGDLPDVDIAPPENVLFVCKLNPVTSDDDLEIIFSRFGVVKSCEVIRDSKTGDSLQYAFVEFEDKKACETAYFKMDNVLIDDRRIHVDFSQSVSRVKWFGKGRGIKGDARNVDFNNLRDGERHPKRERRYPEDRRHPKNRGRHEEVEDRRHPKNSGRHEEVEERRRRSRSREKLRNNKADRSRPKEELRSDQKHRISSKEDRQRREERHGRNEKRERRSRSHSRSISRSKNRRDRREMEDSRHHNSEAISARRRSSDRHKDHRHRSNSRHRSIRETDRDRGGRDVEKYERSKRREEAETKERKTQKKHRSKKERKRKVKSESSSTDSSETSSDSSDSSSEESTESTNSERSSSSSNERRKKKSKKTYRNKERKKKKETEKRYHHKKKKRN